MTKKVLEIDIRVSCTTLQISLMPLSLVKMVIFLFNIFFYNKKER